MRATRQYFLAEAAKQGWDTDNKDHMCSLYLVLLPTLQMACDSLAATRNCRNLQGKKGGIPNERAKEYPRPPHLHRTLPHASLEAWAEAFETSAIGTLGTSSESRAHDALVSCLSGAARRDCSIAARRARRPVS